MAWAGVKALDIALSSPVHSCKAPFVVECCIAVFAATFNPLVLPFLWIAALWLMHANGATVGLCLARILLVLLITTVLKRVTARPRPTLNEARSSELLFNFRSRETNFSMPSGDSAQAALFYAFLAQNSVFPSLLSAALTAATMFARVFYMCHYWGDTVAGAAVGVAVAGIS